MTFRNIYSASLELNLLEDSSFFINKGCNILNKIYHGTFAT